MQHQKSLLELNTIVSEGFKGGPQLVPHYAERRQSLGQQIRVIPD